ncbi:MAG: NAD(P)-dependent oxidoreductase [Terrimicrobiaceae bacterium]
MRIAVTGATGFLGRHAVGELIRRGVEPVILVRPTWTATDEFRNIPAARFDVAAPPDDAFEQLGRPDTLLHLAWGGLPNYKSPHHFETELPTQYRFLKNLVQAGLSHLVISGTCFEYGMQSGCLAETAEAVPANPYGFAKNALHRQLEFLAETTGCKLTWTRLFYLYGKGQHPTSLFMQLSSAAARGDKRFDMSWGEQLRDYLPVEEAARCLTELALGGARAGTVNICSGRAISIRRLVEQWVEENGWQIHLNPGACAYPDYEPMAFWGDRTKLDEALQQNKGAGDLPNQIRTGPLRAEER